MRTYNEFTPSEKGGAAAKEAWMIFWMTACLVGFVMWQVQ